jgi:hypothetical protein
MRVVGIRRHLPFGFGVNRFSMPQLCRSLNL